MLRDLYAARGFLRAAVRLDAPAFEGDTARLPVKVTEGPAARVERVSIEGVAASREAGARQALAVDVQSIYAELAEQAARHRLEQYYRDLGFRDARVAVQPAVSDDGARVALEVRVVEGALHRVREVIVTGLESTNAGMVRKAIVLQPGGVASQAAAHITKQRLYDTGVFRSADVRFDPITAQENATATAELPVDAVVALEESRRYLLRYGLEFAHEYDPTFASYTNGVGVSADIRDRNFLGRGIAAGLGGRYDPSLRSVRAIVAFPRVWNMPFRTNVAVTMRDETTSKPGYKIVDNERDLTLDQRWRAASHLELTWGYTYQDRDLEIDVPEYALPEISVGGVLAGLTSAAVIDFRDSPFDATRGWFHSSSLQLAVRALGSDVGYARYLLRQYHYQPVGPVTLAGAARWGTIARGGGVPPITVLDILFKAGGTTTVRGYAEESLSATTFLGVPIGGTELLLLNGEVRFPIAGWFKGVVFADAGNTFTGQGEFSFNDLAVGLGFGLRVRTPLAPIRIDLGFPQRSGHKSPRLHFSIGQMF
jgi:outer membrane protein insertion porin family